MSSSYQPFLIANFKTGLQLNLEPWLLPQDAFSELQNAYVHDGILMKRRGYTEFADTEAAHPITGILNYIEEDGSKSLLVVDTDRLYEYAAGSLNDLDLADTLTGTGPEFISAVNYKGSIYMANNKDQTRVFNGTAVSDYDIDIDGDTNNDIDYCKYIVAHKERLVILYTTESGTDYPQRARWPVAGSTTDWTNDGYIDCPTADFISGAVLVGDDILVWFTGSIWWLRYTADPNLPFRWERIETGRGNQAPYFPVVRENKSYGFDKSGILITDGFSVTNIDAKIPDFGLTFNQSYVDLCFGVVVEELRQIWVAYPSQDSTTKDMVLAFNYEEGSWAKYTLPFTCFGFFTRQSSLTIDDISWTIDSWAEKIDAQSSYIGYPIILGGKTNGKIYQLLDGTDDDGSDIEMIVESKQWNPYKDKGLKARLGYVDFLVSCNENDSLSVDFYIDFKSESYQTKTLSFDQEGEKAWVRIDCGAEGNSHKIKLYHTASGQRPEIHAIMPWFKPAGRMTY